MKKFILGIIVALLIIVIAFTIFGFKSYKEVKKVEVFLNDYIVLITSDKIEEAYALSSPEFKEVASYDQFVEIAQADALFGGMTSISEIVSWNVQSFPSGSKYVVSATVGYDNGEKANLKALVFKRDGEFTIGGFNIEIDDARASRYGLN